VPENVKHSTLDASARYGDLAKSIDHSLLGPSMTDRELEAGCRLALHYDVASVCIVPYYLARCAEILRGSSVKASTTIGFPHGGHTTAVKMAETTRALEDGGEELDVVVNISKVLSGDWNYVRAELRAIAGVVHQRGRALKVIFENSYLDDTQKIALSVITGEIGAAFAKTSTGFASGGATLADVRLMRAHCPPEVQIKAAGKIHDLDTLFAFRALGATRIGTSRTRDILEDFQRRCAPART
jgi:deoxyribose-phosphate aldolase